MLNLGLLGIHFDAAVVFVTSQTLYSDWLWPYCAIEVAEVEIAASGGCRSGQGPGEKKFDQKF